MKQKRHCEVSVREATTQKRSSRFCPKVSTTAPRFGKFQQTFASNRNSEGAQGAKGAKGAKGAGRGNKVRHEPRGRIKG